MENEDFIIDCERFLKGYHENGADPDDEDTLYEDAILWAMGKIGELASVAEVKLGKLGYSYLVSQENKMGLFKRVVRQESKLPISDTYKQNLIQCS